MKEWTKNNQMSSIATGIVKDESGLNDFQKMPDKHGIAIPKVGISRFRLPLTFTHADGTVMNHDAEASMYVNLEASKTGVNMSRFCSILQEEAGQTHVNSDFLVKMLKRYSLELRDYAHEKEFSETFLKLKFAYPLKQPSLKSNNWGWQYYNAVLEGKLSQGKTRTFLTVKYEYSSTCPCSLSMAKQYEMDFALGKINEGNGIASAHGQRSRATCKIEFDPAQPVSIEQLVKHLRTAIPTETQSLVKRVDEQAFAILNGQYPMFVEHASRYLSLELNQNPAIKDWIVALEHWESLHSHNAVAVINKGIEGGLNQDHLF